MQKYLSFGLIEKLVFSNVPGNKHLTELKIFILKTFQCHSNIWLFDIPDFGRKYSAMQGGCK